MKYLWIVVIAAGIAIVAMSAFQYLNRPGSGDEAPVFELTSIDGRVYALEDVRNRPVIVHFWATWCGVCREEFPALERMYRQMAGSDLVLLAISENKKQEIDEIRSFLKIIPVSFPILLDGDGAVADLYHSFGVPETFFIDRTGRIERRIDNAIDWDNPKVLAYVRELIGQ